MISAWLWDSFLKHVRGMDVTFDSNTTINEKYKILNNVQIPSGMMPTLSYFGLGIGGVGTDLKTGIHRYVDGDLYTSIPMAARPITNDLTPAEADKYRIRSIQTIDGKDYAIYYLKRIDDVNDAVTLKILTKETATNAYGSLTDLDTSNPLILSPSPENILDKVDLTETNYYITSCNIAIDITLDEIDNILDAYKLIYNKDELPLVSEMCLYTGLDTIVDGRTEAYGVRAAVYYAVPHDAQNIFDTEIPIQRYIDIGGVRMM